MYRMILSGIVGLFLLLALAPMAAWAWDDCPLGLVDDPYPGACPRYIDTNGDGICDHSQSEPAPVVPPEPDVAETSSASPSAVEPQAIDSPDLEGLDVLPSGRFRRLTVKDLEELYRIPYEALAPLLQENNLHLSADSALSEVMNLTGWSRRQLIEKLEALTFSQESALIPLSSSPTPPAALAQSTSPSDGGLPAIPKELIVILITTAFLAVLKSASLARTRSHGKTLRWLTLFRYRKILNYALLFSFLGSLLAGILDFFSLRWGWFQSWSRLIVDIHLDSSLILTLLGTVHTFWHWPYYKARLLRKLPRNNSTRAKWAINVLLTLSFLICSLSGLLDIVLVRYAEINQYGQALVAWHLYSSLLMIATGLLHGVWHWRYYLKFGHSRNEQGLSEKKQPARSGRRVIGPQPGADFPLQLSQIDKAREN